jgi:hypothetical protein
MPKRLNLMGLLMGERRGPFQDRFGFEGGFRHVRASSAASKNAMLTPSDAFSQPCVSEIRDSAGFAYD